MRLDSRAAIYCHEFLHKKFAPNAFPGLEPDKPDSVVEQFKNLGFSHEEKALSKLKEIHPKLVVINQKQEWDEIERETVSALLSPDSFLIAGAYIKDVAELELAEAFGVPFIPSQRASRPDLIIKLGYQPDGRPIWAPIDIKSHKAIEKSESNTVFSSSISEIMPDKGISSSGRLESNDLHQLAHYSRHFQSLGIAGDELWVGVIGRDIATCVWAKIGDVVVGKGKAQETFLRGHDEQFAKAQEVVRLSLIENDDLSKKAGVIPINSSGKMGCTVCQFKSTCLKEMQDYDNGHGHVTLLARVTPLVASTYFPDLQSINELAQAIPTNEVMETAQIRARVWQTKIPELINPAEHCEIPEADIEIDIDLENSMEALRELEVGEPIGVDRLYLYGFGIHDRTKDKDWHTATIDTFSDFSNTEEGEFIVFSRMWNRLQAEIKFAQELGKTIKIFHYSPHEYSWWKKFSTRFAERDGVPTLQELEVFRDTYLVDLFPIAKRYSFPTMSYSIKDLAKVAKFEWKVDMAGGANSLFKYRDAVDERSEASVREAAIKWLDSYNRDDVRATLAVRNYMRTLS